MSNILVSSGISCHRLLFPPEEIIQVVLYSAKISLFRLSQENVLVWEVMWESVAINTAEGINSFGDWSSDIQIAAEKKCKIGECFLTCGVFRIFAVSCLFFINWLLYLIWLFLCPSGIPYIILLLNKNLFFFNEAVSLPSTVSRLLGSQHSYSDYTEGRYKQLVSVLTV